MKEGHSILKEELVKFYDRTFVDYHEANYLREGVYSPLKYRQFYIEKMIENQRVPQGSRILDVGCGPGELVLQLLGKAYNVWGIDISPGMVQEATKTVQNGGFPGFQQISRGDVEKLEFEDEFFDVVVAAGVLEYQKDDARALSEMRRVLKKGGYLVLNITNRYSYVTSSESMYLWLKRNRLTQRVLNFVKQHILRRGRLNDFPQRRVHSPKQFDKELAALGFKKVAHNYFRFSPLPVPFDSILSFLCRPAGAYMERLTTSRFGPLGGGYLVLCSRSDV